MFYVHTPSVCTHAHYGASKGGGGADLTFVPFTHYSIEKEGVVLHSRRMAHSYVSVG